MDLTSITMTTAGVGLLAGFARKKYEKRRDEKISDRLSQLCPMELWLDDSWYKVRADGRELFTSVISHQRIRYRVIVRGVIYGRVEFAKNPTYADARYYGAGFSQCSVRCRELTSGWFTINGLTYKEWTEEDRATHTYVFYADGTGTRISFETIRGYGFFAIQIEPTTLPVWEEKQRQWREQRAQERENVQFEKELARVQKEIGNLVATSESLSHWDDPTKLKKYATAHKDELLENAKRIRHSFHIFVTDHNVAQTLRKGNPEVYNRLTFQMRALREAEVIDIEVPERRRPTFEEKRNRNLGWVDVKADDLAAAMDKILTRKAQMLEAARRKTSDPDELDGLEQAINTWAAEALENVMGKRKEEE